MRAALLVKVWRIDVRKLEALDENQRVVARTVAKLLTQPGRESSNRSVRDACSKFR